MVVFDKFGFDEHVTLHSKFEAMSCYIKQMQQRHSQSHKIMDLFYRKVIDSCEAGSSYPFVPYWGLLCLRDAFVATIQPDFIKSTGIREEDADMPTKTARMLVLTMITPMADGCVSLT